MMRRNGANDTGRNRPEREKGKEEKRKKKAKIITRRKKQLVRLQKQV